MKNVYFILIMLLLVMAGCEDNKQSTDDLITVDITKGSFPKKELILQDFMDVEYIALETKDDFLNHGWVQAIGKKIILVLGRDRGDIFVYNRNGKALRKINRKGQGGEEYVSCFNITLDENRNEIFINDIYRKQILVYDLYGKFKRSFKHKEGGGSIFYTDIFNYDKENLICYDQYSEEVPFVLVSKQDGSITKDIKMPFEKKILLQQQTTEGEMVYTVTPGPYRSIIIYKDNWMLSELSSDTVYTLLPDHSLRPSLVRTPPIQSMDPGVFLMLRLLSDRYIFMETIKNVYNWRSNEGFSRTFFIYDKQEKAFFEYIIYNGDYTNKEEIYMNSLKPVNHEIESYQTLDASQLLESYQKGKLKGKLKDIAAELEEDSNPVIMLIKHK
ncbi:6-bladed beta-propeller [uncultured Parabacteroides sp.]|uniref:6-bladed beta-propeller n=1 Tax=uncultured Parabacteroides sp. TaxID=512312 RepID=UPI00280445BB|nr:6-bladed beta-propeller [uncultured Parabacteroides sp.]MBD9166866.1 6-bladed beta-propeller [Parabacteroides johnsonii]